MKPLFINYNYNIEMIENMDTNDNNNLVPEKKYGWYSMKQQKHIGLEFLYQTPNGNQIWVTAVTADINGEELHFKDKVFKGEVTEFVQRRGKQRIRKFSKFSNFNIF